MKIVILTSYGTRGDIQPYFALVLRLKKEEGHEVTLVAGIKYAFFMLFLFRHDRFDMPPSIILF